MLVVRTVQTQKQISPIRLLITSGFGILFDSMDVGILAFVLAVLKKLWHLSPQQVGLLGSINLVGMAIGAATAGMLADKFGRKNVFLWTLLVYSIATGASALAAGFASLLFFRFLVGWGLGGELPVATAYVLESSPQTLRARRVVYLETFWALGSLVASLLSFFVIPSLGWRMAFLIGAVPALYAFILRKELPETPLFQKITERKSVWSHLSTIWSKPVRRKSFVLWVLWFVLNFSYYGMFLWLPSVMILKGYSLVSSFGYVLIMTFAQVPGYISAAYLVETWGRKKVIVLYLFLSACFAVLFGFSINTGMLLISGIGLSFFNLGTFGAMYAYTAEQYPTDHRGTGMGWAMGFGRIGGIVAPYLVGSLLGIHQSISSIFFIFFGVMCIGSLVTWIVGNETKPTS